MNSFLLAQLNVKIIHPMKVYNNNYARLALLHYFRGLKWIIVFSIIIFLVAPLTKETYASNEPEVTVIDSLKHVLKRRLSNQDQIKTLSALGNAYLDKPLLDSALNTENYLLDFISKHGTKADSAKCYKHIGLIYMHKAWYDKALDNLMRSQQLYSEVGDSAAQAYTLMNVGIVHDNMDNLPMAISYYQKAYAYFKRKNNGNGMAACELNMAIVYTKQDKFDLSSQYLLNAANVYKKSGNNLLFATALFDIGLNYKKKKEYDKAIDYLEQALKIWKKMDDKYRICYYYLNMGEIMLSAKRTDQAAPFLLKGEKLAQVLDSKDLIMKAYEYLSDYNAAKKNYSIAYDYLLKSRQLSDSILNAETAEKVNQIQYHYEIAKREVVNDNLTKQNLNKELQLSKENQVLYTLAAILLLIVVLVIFLFNQNNIKRKANKQLETQNDFINSQKNELIKLNASKDKFLSILAHDIKNPLSSIFAIRELLLSDFDRLTDEEMRTFTKDINTLADNLFEIISTLLTWGMTQSGLTAFNPQPFSIGTLCRKSVNTLQAVAKQKEIILVDQTDERLTVLADENMILSVLHNLINNAIKFSYRGTKIYVESCKLDGVAQIMVMDSGIGLSPESKTMIFRYDQHFLSRGTSGEAGTGLGLILCKDFIEKNGGTIHVESELKKGSTFVFTLPLAEDNKKA